MLVSPIASANTPSSAPLRARESSAPRARNAAPRRRNAISLPDSTQVCSVAVEDAASPIALAAVAAAAIHAKTTVAGRSTPLDLLASSIPLPLQ
jgi:hypothetical protein